MARPTTVNFVTAYSAIVMTMAMPRSQICCCGTLIPNIWTGVEGRELGTWVRFAWYLIWAIPSRVVSTPRVAMSRVSADLLRSGRIIRRCVSAPMAPHASKAITNDGAKLRWTTK